MKHALFGTLLLTFLVCADPRAQEGLKPGVVDLTKTVGVVDMVKVSDAYPRREQVKAMIAKREQELNDKLNEVKKKRDTLVLEIKALDRKSEEYAEKEHEIQMLDIEGEALDKRFGRKMQEISADALSQIYKEILAAVAEIAKQRGLLLVLRSRDAELMAQMQRKPDPFENRDVLYFDKSLDISDDVIKLMKANPAPAVPEKGTPPKSGTSDAGGTKK